MDALLQKLRRNQLVQRLYAQLNAKPQLYMRGSIILTITIALILVSACSNQTQVPSSVNAPIIRVKLVQAADGVMVSGNGETLVQVAGESAPHRLRLPAETPIMITRGRDGWHIGNVVLGGPTGSGGSIVISPAHDGDFAVVGKIYRGRFRLMPDDASPPPGSPALAAMGLVNSSSGLKFDVINDVDVDSYLNSVITGEMPRTFGDEAYKAQAIVARTYALYEQYEAKVANRDFDVYADTRSQVYAGFTAETDRSRAAVKDTSGIVVAAGPPGQERIFKAYFSACCGGIGQSAADAFGDPPTRELSEQKVGKLCNESPRYNWSPVEISKAELTRRIRSWGAKRGRPERDIATLASLQIQSYNQFGRPVRFILTDATGRRYSLTGEETRWACNADAGAGPTLISSYFNPINEPDSIRFSDGHGSGHGVGMCQWCAEARSEQGMRHEDIVILSYPGTKLVRAY